jgi:predicted DNA-binding transcriptional regulator AlpA
MPVKTKAVPPFPRRRLFSEEEVLRYLGVSRSTLDGWVKAGHFPRPIRIGGPRTKKFWPIETIDAAIAALAGGAP